MVATRQDSVFYTHTLPNGLQLLGQYMPDVQSAAAVFWVNTGTRDEDPSEMGVSHFLEHMAFKRTPRYSGEEIDYVFESLGADHNAATGREMTFYWARVLGENVRQTIDVLAELTHPSLTPEDFDQERHVILEEIARAEDQLSHVLFSCFLRDYFGDHPLALDTLGTADTIRALTVEEMQAYWSNRYGTSNILFAVAGNFDWDDLVQHLEEVTTEWQAGDPARKDQPADFSPGFHVHTRPQFMQEQIAIGVPFVSRTDPRTFAASIIATILGDDRGSRLFWSLYHTGLAETASAETLDFEDNGIMLVHLASEPGRAAEALRAARAEMARIQEFDITEEELQRAKTKLNSSVVIGGESTNERMMGLINSWLTKGRLETLEELREQIDAVTLEDLRSLVRDLPLSPAQTVTAVGPLSEADLRPGLD